MILCEFKDVPKNTSCFYELQYCKHKKGAPEREIVSVEKIKFKDETSLFVLEDRFESFFETYSKIFDGGIYNNLKSGVPDVFGINWYSPGKTGEIIKRFGTLKEKPDDSALLLSWLLKAEKEYNGFYFLGL